MGYNTQVKQLSDFYDAYGLSAGDDEDEDDGESSEDNGDRDDDD